jgi:hypothetical protein
MNTKEQYRLREAEQQARLGEFLTSSSLASLENEIALARTLLETATNAGNVMLVRDLLGVIGKLIHTHRQQMVQDGQLLGKAAVETLAESIVSILIEELDGIDPRKIDIVADRISGAIGAVRN